MGKEEERIAYLRQTPTEIRTIRARHRTALKVSQGLLGNKTSLWLDIGSNLGFGLEELCPSRNKVIAVDIDPEYIQLASERNPKVRGVATDGCHLGFSSERFDLVSLFEVIEHMGEVQQRNLLAEANRILKPEGILLLSTPNKDAHGKRQMGIDHERELRPQELKQLLSEGGFIIQDIFGQIFLNGSLFHGILQNVRVNPLATFIYYQLIPFPLRRVLSDFTLSSQNPLQIRSPKPYEIPRIMFVVCQKNYSSPV